MRNFKIIFALFLGFLILSSCSKEIEDKKQYADLTVRNVEGQIETNCKIEMQGVQGYNGGPKVYNTPINQVKLNQFLSQMYISGSFVWEPFMVNEYGLVYEEMALYFAAGQSEIVKLPIFNNVTKKVSSFFTIQKSQNNFIYEFVDREFNDIRLQNNPYDMVVINNDNFFQVFDYGTCNTNILPDFGPTLEGGDCITASGTYILLQAYECDCNCECVKAVEADYVNIGPCPPTTSGGVYGGDTNTGGNTSTSTSTSNRISMANQLHNDLKYYYPEYWTSFQALGYASLAEAVANLGPAGSQYGSYLKVGKAYQRVMKATENQTAILPVVAWLLKELAEFGTGALIDFVLQFTLEYWMGGHPSLSAAWAAINIDELQVIFSGMEAFYKEKYVAMAASATTDLAIYLKNTKVEDITALGISSHVGFGAISGFLGTNAADYVGKIGGYMAKYGPQKPFDKLKALNIHSFFFTLPSFRSVVIEKVWANPSWTGRGRALEEIASYGRYKNMTWVNAAGETGGPLDYLSGSLGIQLKTSAATTWNGVRQNAVNALNQLKQAKTAGTITSGRLDLMMPQSLSGNFSTWKSQIDDLIATDYSGLNLSVEVGSFIE